MNDVIAFPSAALPPPSLPSRVAFTGQRREFRHLVTRGGLLELVTVGFYRFWLATDMRRHLWSHTSVEGDAPEYTGTAKELLIGFLFALAILAPVYLAYFLVGLEAERLKAFASTPLALFFYLFTQFAIYRARRYRLTRTVWRGVRFWMAGSGVGYAWRAGLWAVLMAVTLGLALPWAHAALERYKMRHTSYGELKGSFEGTGWELFKRGWWLWLLAWPSVFLLMIPLPFIFGAFKAIEWRWWVNGLRFGEVRFESNLRKSALFGVYWSVIGWFVLLTVLFAGVFGVVAGPVFVAAGDHPEQAFAMFQQLSVLIPLGLAYLALGLGSGIVMRLYLIRDIWQRVAQSVTVHNLAAAENVAAQGELVSALGEGFANSLDVVGF